MNTTIRKLMAGMLVGCICLSLAFTKDENELAKLQKILVSTGSLLEQQHYLSPVINDDFSKAIWTEYLNFLDSKKNILLQADVDELKKYDTYLDNEIHGDSLRFFPAAMRIYVKRSTEVSSVYRDILVHPFTFGENDFIQLDRTPKGFPENEEERKIRWRNFLKYLALQKLIDLQEQRVQSKPGDALYRKTDVQLELEARQFLLRQYDRVSARIIAADQNKSFSNYLNVITRYVDPHSDYLAPLEKKLLDEKMSSLIFGIGVQLSEADGVVKMIYFAPGSPAQKAGVFSVNDQITKIGQGENGVMIDIGGMDIQDVSNLIRGAKGTVVRIGYKKSDGNNHVIPLVRAEIKQDETLARSAIIEEKGKKIGYINLPIFYDDPNNIRGVHCADDVAAEIVKLKASQVDGLVMDLRFNGGGSLKEVVKMVGLFVGRGPVVQTKDSKGDLQTLQSWEVEPLYTGPLTVLVNENSASASEIFAGAIQDYKRGVVIGTRTFGKGTVQTTVPLGSEDQGVLKLTISKFYRVEGSSTQQQGVIPDIILPDGVETANYHEGNMPNALQWDRVTKLDYNQAKTNIDSLTKLAEIRIGRNVAFSNIKVNNNWWEVHPDTAAQMTVAQYRATLAAGKKISMQNRDSKKLLAADWMLVKPVIAPVGGKRQSYSDWFKKIAADLQIKEALKVTLDMVK